MVKYSDYSNVFSAKNTVKLLENTGINEHAIELEENKQSSFRSIYGLGPMKFKTLKTYIETNLANSFICPSKFLIAAPILFDRKPNRSLRLLRRLLESEQYNYQKPIPATSDW